jgi:2-(1,2-epoxy-1,2-dihydrophenyl)acetyl-CoA isomerase
MQSILFEVKGNIAFITLNRPEKLNAFNREMALALQESLRLCMADNIRSVCLTGAGKAFSAGQDLDEVLGAETPGVAGILHEQLNPIISAISSLQKPVLAAVNGVAAGAGANLALCCDVVIATHSALFIQAFSKIGLIPDSGGTYFLPRLIGWQKASAIMLLGDKITATEAEKMGMIYRCYEDEKFDEAAEKINTTLALLPTRALALTKLALQFSSGNSLAQQLAKEDELQQVAAGTADFKEGVQAFTEKRQPQFTGK